MSNLRFKLHTLSFGLLLVKIMSPEQLLNGKIVCVLFLARSLYLDTSLMLGLGVEIKYLDMFDQMPQYQFYDNIVGIPRGPCYVEIDSGKALS